MGYLVVRPDNSQLRSNDSQIIVQNYKAFKNDKSLKDLVNELKMSSISEKSDLRLERLKMLQDDYSIYLRNMEGVFILQFHKQKNAFDKALS